MALLLISYYFITLVIIDDIVAISFPLTTNNLSPAPKGCKWHKININNNNNNNNPIDYNSGGADSAIYTDNININNNDMIDDIIKYKLNCKLRTINDVINLFNNLTSAQADRIQSLRIECNSVLFYESSFDFINRHPSNEPFLNKLRNLMEIDIEFCKIKNLPDLLLENLRELKSLTLNTHNSDWTIMNLEMNTKSFYGLTELKTLNLADNSIWSLPTNVFCPMSSLKQLNLTKNRLTDISALAFSDWGEGPQAPGKACNTALELLDLSYNNIEQLQDNGFSALRSLQILLLNDNYITILAERSFVGLQSLLILNISSNRMTAVSPELIKSPRNLKQIYLRNNSISVLAPGALEGLDYLEVLDLSQNQLTSTWVKRYTFEGLKRLIILQLNYNALQKIDSHIFEGLYNLQILNLENNRIGNITEDAFKDLKNLHSLTLSNNLLEHIDAHLFSELYALNLLFLDSNRIHKIHVRAFENLTILNDLSLNDNLLHEIPNGLQHLRFLKSLDLGKNRIRKINGSVFDGLEQLSGLRLVDNLITNLTKDIFISLSSINVLNLSTNKIKYIDPNAFSSNPTIKAIRLDDNDLNDISMIFKLLPELAWLNVSDNNINWFNYNHLPESIEWLDIHKNNIIELENNASGGSSSSIIIDESGIINNNNNMYNDIVVVNKLKMLDVSFNNIKQITDQNIPNAVEVLYLNNNDIDYIGPGTFLHKSNLQKVILYGNKLKYIDPAALSIISQIPTMDNNNNNHLYNDVMLPEFFMGNNPIHCNCKMEWLPRINELSNLHQYPRVLDLDQIFCTLEHNHVGGGNHIINQADNDYYTNNNNNNNEDDFYDNNNFNIGKTRGGGNLITKSIIDLKTEDFVCHYTSHCFAACHCCDFNACDCKMTCPQNCNCYHDHIWKTNIVDCGNNNNNGTKTDLVGLSPMDATVIYLDGNNLTILKSHMFIGKKKLQFLYLNSSNIQIIQNRTFHDINLLKILHLESNQLTELHSHEFEQLKQLNELYLHNNKIHNIVDEMKIFKNLINLNKLTLYGNRLVNFQPWKQEIPSLQTLLIFNNNRYTNCNCKMINELQMLMANAAVHTDYKQLKCENDKRSIESIFQSCTTADNNINNNQNDNNNNNNNNDGLATPAVQRTILLNGNNTNLIGGNFVPIVAAILVTIIGMALLVALICVYRQDVRLWAHAKYGIRLFKDPTIQAINQQNDDDTIKLYDAYIIYSQIDTDFCTKKFATELHHLGYKLSLHYDINYHHHHQHQHHHPHSHSHPHQHNNHLHSHHHMIQAAHNTTTQQQHPNYQLSTTCLIDTLQCQIDITNKILLIISMNFLQNEWSQPQFRLALQTIIENIHPISLRRHKFIIILTIPMDIITMDPFMQTLMQQCPVINWDDKRFWDKLRYLLPDINNKTLTRTQLTAIMKKNNAAAAAAAAAGHMAPILTNSSTSTSQSTPTASITSNTNLKKHSQIPSRSPQLRYTPAPTTATPTTPTLNYDSWCPPPTTTTTMNNKFNCINNNNNCICDCNEMIPGDCNNIMLQQQNVMVQQQQQQLQQQQILQQQQQQQFQQQLPQQAQAQQLQIKNRHSDQSQSSPSQSTSHTEDESSCESTQIYEPAPIQNYICRSSASSLGHVYSTIPETPQMVRNINVNNSISNNNSSSSNNNNNSKNNNNKSGRAYFV